MKLNRRNFLKTAALAVVGALLGQKNVADVDSHTKSDCQQDAPVVLAPDSYIGGSVNERWNAPCQLPTNAKEGHFVVIGDFVGRE